MSKDTAAAGAVLDYLTSQKRPYSAIDIFNNLHKEHGKAVITRALEHLVQSGQVKEKTYGKQKVYVENQMNIRGVNEEENKKLDDIISELNVDLQQSKLLCKNQETELRHLNAQLSVDELKVKLKQVNEESLALRAKLQVVKGTSNISVEERKQVTSKHATLFKEWKTRKRKANAMIEAILEGYPKSKKHFMEEVCLENDQEFCHLLT